MIDSVVPVALMICSCSVGVITWFRKDVQILGINLHVQAIQRFTELGVKAPTVTRLKE